MTSAVLGATGRVGSLVVDGLLERGESVLALVRNPGKARERFGAPAGLEVRQAALDRTAALTGPLAGVDTVVVAMGSVGVEGALQRIAIDAAAAASVKQLVRLSVLNASPDSRGINQRAHWSIDVAAEAVELPYATVRPAIFSASLLAAAPEIRASRTWTGLAQSGRVPLADHRDVAEAMVRIVRDPGTWGRHHELTGPDLFSWPEAIALLSAELGEALTFVGTDEHTLLERLATAGVPPGHAQLLIAREWAILAGENERSTTALEELIGHAPHTVASFLRDYRHLFI